MTNIQADLPKTPRWITTEAGNWAWNQHEVWRNHARRALSVQDRQQLLSEAERLQQTREYAE